ncbi:MAG: enoyl-CoA hydratase [Pseudomonadota bacterium]|jgi:enoyl-CoA hydratase/carnithine racemase
MNDALPALQGMTERMIVRKEGPLGWIVFNQPARHNAMSVDMWEALPRIVEAYEADPEIRVIIITGAGDRAFVSGADISQFGERRGTMEAVKEYNAIADHANDRLQACSKPVIAMIRGFCIGGGLGIALGADIRVCAEDAQFAVPAAKLGLGYRFSGIKRLADIVGPSFAAEIFYTARRFNAREAEVMGLVNRVVPVDRLEAATRELASVIAENAPMTVQSVKLIIRNIHADPDARDLDACARAVENCFASEDYKEGRTAFMEKRKPRFQGR